MTEDKNIHAGHRDRLLELLYRSGIENVSDIQRVEHFLTYIFPRGDVNPLAHRLLDKFGSLANIQNASVGELMSVRGIGERAAKRISLFTQYYQFYEAEMLSEKENLTLYSSLCDYCEGFLRLSNVEELHIIALNASGILIRKDCLAKGKINYVTIPTRTITNFIISTNPAFVVLLHNHPGGKAVPTKKDREGTKYLAEVIKLNSANFVEHLIVGIDGIYGIKHKKYLRTYSVDGIDI